MRTTSLIRYWLFMLLLLTMPIQGHSAQNITMNYLSNTTPFQAVDLDTISASGQPTLVKLWASSCPQCLQELRSTEALANDPELQGIKILTLVSPGQLNELPQDEFETWFTGLKDYHQLPLALDPKGQWVQELGVRAYPSWALFNDQGDFVRLIPGSLNKAQILALKDNPQADLHASPTTPVDKAQTAQPTLRETDCAGGCSWGVEGYFERLAGAVGVLSGYSNGRTEHPTYQH